MKNIIIVDDILAKHFYEKYGKDTITWKGSMFKITYQEWVTKAIKEIVEAVLEEAAENAKIHIGGTYKTQEGHLANTPSYVIKSSILNTKEQIKY